MIENEEINELKKEVSDLTDLVKVEMQRNQEAINVIGDLFQTILPKIDDLTNKVNYLLDKDKGE